MNHISARNAAPLARALLFVLALLLFASPGASIANDEGQTIPQDAEAPDSAEPVEGAPDDRDARMERLEKQNAELLKELRVLRKRVEKLEKPAMAAPGTEEHEAEEATFSKEQAEALEEIKERVELVESETEETKFSILSGLVNVSGYADAEFHFTDDHEEQSRFRIHHLSLFFKKEIQDRWKFFSEVEYEDAPLMEGDDDTALPTDLVEGHGKIFVEQMYIEYRPIIELDVRFGRFLTPAGIWNIYHYPPYVPTQTRPLIVRSVFPQVSDGMQLWNTLTMGGAVLDTHLYVSNGSGNPGKTDFNENKAVGARVNFAPGILDGFDIGGSYYGEKSNSGDRRHSYGAHLRARYGNLTLQGEFAGRKNDMGDGAVDYDNMGAYGQLSYDVGKWTLAGRYDWYDADDSMDDDEIFRYTGAINYHFAHNVVGKLEYDYNEFEDPLMENFHEVIAAIVIAIGDL
jgi:hypothetical protein